MTFSEQHTSHTITHYIFLSFFYISSNVIVVSRLRPTCNPSGNGNRILPKQILLRVYHICVEHEHPRYHRHQHHHHHHLGYLSRNDEHRSRHELFISHTNKSRRKYSVELSIQCLIQTQIITKLKFYCWRSMRWARKKSSLSASVSKCLLLLIRKMFRGVQIACRLQKALMWKRGRKIVFYRLHAIFFFCCVSHPQASSNNSTVWLRLRGGTGETKNEHCRSISRKEYIDVFANFSSHCVRIGFLWFQYHLNGIIILCSLFFSDFILLRA